MTSADKKLRIFMEYVKKLIQSNRLKDKRINELRAENYRLREDIKFYKDGGVKYH